MQSLNPWTTREVPVLGFSVETRTHFVLRLWILLKPSVLADSLMLLWQKEGGGAALLLPGGGRHSRCLTKVPLKPEVREDTPYYCWVGVEVQTPLMSFSDALG